MAAVRDEVNTLGTRVAALTDSLHRDEVANAQAALRIEQLEQTVLEQFGMAPADLVAEYGPQVLSYRRRSSRWPNSSRPANVASR